MATIGFPIGCSRGKLPDVATVRSAHEKVQGSVKIVESAWSVVSKLPRVASVGFKRIQVLCIIDFPFLVRDAWKAKGTAKLSAIADLYFWSYDIREAIETFLPFSLVPGFELPIVALVGMGSVAHFAKNVVKYHNLKKEAALLNYQTAAEVKKYLNELQDTKKEIWISGFKALAAFAFLAAVVFAPGAKEFYIIFHVARGIGLGLALLKPYLPNL